MCVFVSLEYIGNGGYGEFCVGDYQVVQTGQSVPELSNLYIDISLINTHTHTHTELSISSFTGAELPLLNGLGMGHLSLSLLVSLLFH